MGASCSRAGIPAPSICLNLLALFLSYLALLWRRHRGIEENPAKPLLFTIKLGESWQCCHIIREGRELGRGQREGEEQPECGRTEVMGKPLPVRRSSRSCAYVAQMARSSGPHSPSDGTVGSFLQVTSALLPLQAACVPTGFADTQRYVYPSAQVLLYLHARIT